MNAIFGTNAFSDGLANLKATHEWEQIANATEIVYGFNLFSLLEDALCENAWSRFFCYFFDSTSNHGLGLAAIQDWIKTNLPDKFADLLPSVTTSIAETEWGTFERRRLDILVRLLDKSRRLVGIIGIENKVWSGEQPHQLSAYQEALSTAFPEVPKILVFLSPDGRSPTTSRESAQCPVKVLSYQSLVEVCEKLVKIAGRNLSPLLSELANYINVNITRKYIMDAKIQEAVAKLYQDPQTRRTIELIVENRPTLRPVFEQVAANVRNQFKSIAWTHNYYPETSDSPSEFRIWPKLSSLPESSNICYMLASSTNRPFIGDSFTILLNGWCGKHEARKSLSRLSALLPRRQYYDWKSWSDWELLWQGENCKLTDLATQDADALSRVLTDAISLTLSPLQAALNANREKP